MYDIKIYMFIISYFICIMFDVEIYVLIIITGTRVHSVIYVISLKLNIFPFSASILTFSTQNHLVLTYFTHFETTHFF